jgi:hypothetical protein
MMRMGPYTNWIGDNWGEVGELLYHIYRGYLLKWWLMMMGKALECLWGKRWVKFLEVYISKAPKILEVKWPKIGVNQISVSWSKLQVGHKIW